MEAIQKVAERIVDLSPSSPDRDTQVYAVNRNIFYLIHDLLALLKNINETSLPGEDRQRRLQELETKYGIPVKHLL